MSCDLDNIRHNSARGRQLSGAAPVKHGVSQNIPMHKNGVEYIVHAVERMFRRQKERRNHCRITVLCLLTGGQKAYDSAHRRRIPDIRRRDVRDPLRVNILIVHLLSADQGSQNRNLSAGIISFYIRSRIFLRISLVLGIF